VGLTVVEKSHLHRRRQANPKIALVLAGGAISGGAFKLGGLIALNTYLEGRKMHEFDMYVGVSAGAFLAAPLSSGIPPEELIRSIHGGSSIISQFKPWHFYWPNFSEFVQKPAEAAWDAATAGPALARSFYDVVRSTDGRRLAKNWFLKPTYNNLERLMTPVILGAFGDSPLVRSMLSYLPSGVFDNSPIETFIRENLQRNRLPNNFKLLQMVRHNSLYIFATNLNTARSVLFGHDEDTSATISEAVQASCSIPGFFKPTRIGTADYLDGGVQRTANISQAAAKGADLIIAYNPFRPYVNLGDPSSDRYRSMASMGPGVVLDQTFRSLLHSRLELGVKRLALDPRFRGDLLLIEPTETDARMFNISPIAFWKRAIAAEAGYLSVKATLERHHARLTRIFESWGFKTNLERLKEDESALLEARTADREVFDVLERDSSRSERERQSSQKFYVVK
jgi:NTE family protein